MESEHLQIKGFFDQDKGHYFIETYFICDQLKQPIFLKFIIDTGATTSTILDGHCEILGLNCQQLSTSTAVVVGSKIQVSILPDIAFGFIDTQKKLHWEQLDSVTVIEPTVDSPKPSFSIIGMDVLQRFDKLVYDFQRNEVILER